MKKYGNGRASLRYGVGAKQSARLLLKMSDQDDAGCLICPYPTNYKKLPYSRIRVEGKLILAHRHIYEQMLGPIPLGMIVMHKCDNAACINPRHLKLGTHRDNIKDRDSKDRANRAIGERNYNSRFTAADIPKIIKAVNSGLSMGAVGRKYGVSTAAISSVYNGKTWKHVPR